MLEVRFCACREDLDFALDAAESSKGCLLLFPLGFDPGCVDNCFRLALLNRLIFQIFGPRPSIVFGLTVTLGRLTTLGPPSPPNLRPLSFLSCFSLLPLFSFALLLLHYLLCLVLLVQ